MRPPKRRRDFKKTLLYMDDVALIEQSLRLLLAFFKCRGTDDTSIDKVYYDIRMHLPTIEADYGRVVCRPWPLPDSAYPTINSQHEGYSASLAHDQPCHLIPVPPYYGSVCKRGVIFAGPHVSQPLCALLGLTFEWVRRLDIIGNNTVYIIVPVSWHLHPQGGRRLVEAAAAAHARCEQIPAWRRDITMIVGPTGSEFRRNVWSLMAAIVGILVINCLLFIGTRPAHY